MQAWVHPETQKEEVFLSNVRRDEMRLIRSWKTARVGVQAYNMAHEKLGRSLVPVFVSLAEYRERYWAYNEAAV